MRDMSPEIAELIEECQVQIESPPRVNGSPDQYIAMFSEALMESLSGNEEAREAISTAIIRKREFRPFSSSFAFNSILRLFQMDKMDEANYPYEKRDDWQMKVSDYFKNSKSLGRMAIDIQMWNVGSDVESRIAGPKLVAQMLQGERVDSEEEPYTILNVGSARDHGLAMIASNILLDRVMLDRSVGYRIDEHELETTINGLVNRPINIGESYGVDLWPLRDPDWSQFLRACRYYPSELNDLTKRRRYNELESIRDGDMRLHHVDADFSLIDSNPCFSNGYLKGMSEDNSYDMILFSTSLHQNYPEKRRKMIDNARRLLKASGLIVVQDFCTQEDGDFIHPIDRLDFVGPTSRPHVYSTHFMRPEEDHLTKFASWNNGRCEQIRPTEFAVEQLT